MAHGPVRKPYLRERRFDALTGGAEARRLAYFIRKHLGYDRAQFAALPWHEQQMWMEELIEDPTVPLEFAEHTDDLSTFGFAMRKA